jgi:hypothetical protein
LQIAVCVVCTPNTCANFNNESRSDTLVWVALCNSVAGLPLPFPGALVAWGERKPAVPSRLINPTSACLPLD